MAAHGLMLRGGFNFAVCEAPPPSPSGAAARSVLLVGQAGAAPWPHFLRWRGTTVINPLSDRQPACWWPPRSRAIPLA
ncbi:MAG: hypothetical protein EOR99_03160 [Mesorhizobium sp.]|nr:MAG: hypothetical protein EOR99_03160 [Mesorhizobium sp.]